MRCELEICKGRQVLREESIVKEAPLNYVLQSRRAYSLKLWSRAWDTPPTPSHDHVAYVLKVSMDCLASLIHDCAMERYYSQYTVAGSQWRSSCSVAYWHQLSAALIRARTLLLSGFSSNGRLNANIASTDDWWQLMQWYSAAPCCFNGYIVLPTSPSDGQWVF